MKRFAFSLQYLLDAHQSREQAAEQALHRTVKKRLDKEDELDVVQNARKRQTQAMEKMHGVVKRSELATYMRSIETYEHRLSLLNGDLQKIKEQERDCRDELRKQMMARRTLEKLCEREREGWSEEMQAAEQKYMDELAVGRWSRAEKKQ